MDQNNEATMNLSCYKYSLCSVTELKSFHAVNFTVHNVELRWSTEIQWLCLPPLVATLYNTQEAAHCHCTQLFFPQGKKVCISPSNHTQSHFYWMWVLVGVFLSLWKIFPCTSSLHAKLTKSSSIRNAQTWYWFMQNVELKSSES